MTLTRSQSVTRIPDSALETLRPLAIERGHSGSRASIIRFAVVELAARVKRETDPQQSKGTAETSG